MRQSALTFKFAMAMMLFCSAACLAQRPGEGKQGLSQGAQTQERGRRRAPRMPLFNAIDSDGDATLSAEELSNATESLKALDTDGDGAISREDFSQLIKQRVKANRGDERPGKEARGARAEGERARGERKSRERKSGDENRGRRFRSQRQQKPEGRGQEGRGQERRRDRNDRESRPDRGRHDFGKRIESLDIDKDGSLSESEIPERLQRMLKRFDENSDGSLEPAELDAMRQRFHQSKPRRPADSEADSPADTQ